MFTILDNCVDYFFLMNNCYNVDHVCTQVEMVAEDPDARLARSGSGHNSLTADASLWQAVDETGITKI